MILLRKTGNRMSSIEGNNLQIDGSNTLTNFKIFGKHYQASYEGNNLYDYTNTYRVTSGVTVDNDGWITVSYNNASSYKNFDYDTNKLNLETSTNYSIVVEIKEVSGNGTLTPSFNLSNSASEAIQFEFVSGGSINYSFSELNANDVKIFQRQTKNDFTNCVRGIATDIKFESGQTGSITFRISILADTTVTPSTFIYEPYTGEYSPSENYPQQIETVTGTNTLTIANSNNTQQQTFTLNLGSIELLDNEKIYKDNNWVVYKEYAKISSYAGETISGDYISTTGTLSTGATVYYKMANPTTTTITDTTLTDQLDDVLDADLYLGTNNISISGDLIEKIGISYLEYYSTFEFDKILRSGYNIKEDNDRITQKFANGHRKQIISDYEDCIIKIDLGTFDLETTIEYIEQLTDGAYQYYSLKDNKYKTADFIIEERPEIIIESAIDNNATIEDFEITLLKAGD